MTLIKIRNFDMIFRSKIDSRMTFNDADTDLEIYWVIL